ncbi:MAG: outer membrane beta-barrel protein, partial [Candidatus Mariimomonas ferrooxydans]
PNSELTALEKRFRNILDAYLAYDREKIKIEGGFSMVRDDYDNFNNLDKTDNMFSGAYFYQIFPKTSIFGEYDYGVIEYDTNRTNSDSKYHQGRLGVEGNLGPKLTGTVKAGYRQVRYDEDDKDDFSGFTLFGNIRYDATERTVLNLYAERTSVESSYATNSHFEVNNIGIKLDHQLLKRLWFNGESFFQLNQYPDETIEGSRTAKRKDKLFGIGAGLKYEVNEWWLVSTGYKFKQRASNFDVFDYNDHRILAQVLVVY